MVGYRGHRERWVAVKYDVKFTVKIDDPEVLLTDLFEALPEVPSVVYIHIEGSDTLVAVCKDVESSGLMALPEAMRKTQVKLSHAFRAVSPVFSARGGLLWSDIVAADVRTAE